jgi:hypothetical protein
MLIYKYITLVESVNRRKLLEESNLLEGMVVRLAGLMQKGESERVVLIRMY